MQPTTREDRPATGIAGAWKLTALAVVLAAGTWAALAILVPQKLPDGFPNLPATRTMNPGLRTLIKSLDKDARAHSDSPAAIGKLGMAYHANQYLAQAASAYRIAASLAPSDSQWVYCQAVLEEENGNAQRQFELLQQAARLKPDHVPALLKLADALFKRQSLDQAEHDYELASHASGRNSFLQAEFGLARIAAERRNWSRVVELTAPLSRNYSTARPPLQLLQTAYEALQQADKAAEIRETLLVGTFTTLPPAEDPFNDRLIDLCYSSTRLLKEAGTLKRFGYPDRALQLARRAAEADPADADVRNFIARTLLAAYGSRPEAIDEALTQLGECLRLKPDDLVPLWGFASDFFDTPKAPDAIERLRSLVTPHANREEAHFSLGLLADAQGRKEEAVSQYQAALQSNPNNSAAYNKLGLILADAGRFEPALEQFQRSVQLDPMNTVARFNMGVTLMQMDRYEQGLKELREVLRFKPHDAPTHFCMAFAFLYSNRLEQAVSQFHEGMRFKQDDPESHFGLASALSRQHKQAGAVAEVREALRLRPNYPDAQELLQRLDR